MKLIKNENGIALVTALMFTLLSLVMVSTLMMMTTRSTKISGLSKAYKSSLEAAHGGAEVFTKDMLPTMLTRLAIDSNPTSLDLATAITGFTDLSLAYPSTGATRCSNIKMLQETYQAAGTLNWPAPCKFTVDPMDSPDFKFQLPSTTGDPFLVYAKIVDTRKGNTDRANIAQDEFDNQGTVRGGVASSTTIRGKTIPWVYKLEIQAERGERSLISGVTRPKDGGKARLEVLYAY